MPRNRKICFSILFTSLFFIFPFLAEAQTQRGHGVSPGATTQRLQEDRAQQNLEKVLEKKDQDQVILNKDDVEPDRSQLDTKKIIQIKGINTNPSAVLSVEEITAITGSYIGQTVSMQDLYGILDQIDALYEEKDVISAKAILPPQSIKDGVIDIELVESMVDEIRLEGNETTKSNFILAQVELESGDFFDLHKLEQSLMRFNTLYDVSLRASLAPGQDFGTTIIDIIVQEPAKYSAIIFGDNAGREEIGYYRLGGYATHRSVFGRRDAFTAGAVITEGSRNVFLSYDIPVSKRGTRVGASFDYSNTNLVTGPLEQIDVQGDFFNVSLFANHPLITSEKMIIKALASFDWKKSTNAFEDLFTFEGSVYNFSAGTDGVFFMPQSYIYNKHMLTVSSNDFDNGTRTFLRYHGDGEWQKRVNERIQLKVKGKIQLASDELLPSSEQFQLGGMATIRGYPEGMLVGDNGYLLSAEFSTPFTWIDKAPKVKDSRLFLFFDNGSIFTLVNDAVENDNQEMISGIGGGISSSIGEYVSGKLTLGFPLKSHNFNEDDDLRFNFFVQAKF